VKNVILHLKRKKYDRSIVEALALLDKPDILIEDVNELLDYIKELNMRKKKIADELGNSVSWI
jgi:hypothetical protein